MNKDTYYLNLALEQARLGRGFCAPNPAVGAVIVAGDSVLAEGYHHGPGLPHAEIEALKKINYQAKGATLYVTLEPCCHYGKTPPCTDAIIRAGITRVVYGYPDPNPIVFEKSNAILLANNITCVHLPSPEINNFYASYEHWWKYKTPFITAKIAMTLDGKIADEQSRPIPITGPELQRQTHILRKQSDAILTTAATIIADDPKLNVRLTPQAISKPLYILDSHLSIPSHAQVFTTAQSVTLFHDENAIINNNLLQYPAVRLIPVPSNPAGLDLLKIIEHIGKEGIHDLWIEAGARCFNAFLREKLLNRAIFYIAPWTMGQGKHAFDIAHDFRDKNIEWHVYGKDILCDVNLS